MNPPPEPPPPNRRNRLAAAFAGALLLAAAPDESPVLDNPWTSVHRRAAPCRDAGPGCGDRVIVSFGEVRIVRTGGPEVQLGYADVLVAEAGETYRIEGDDWVEVNLKPERPPVEGPAEVIAADKNQRLHTGAGYFVFEERLDPGDTRPRHSHAQRVVLVMNSTRLQQWPDGADEVFKTQIPGTIKFNPPVVHIVKNIGEAPLRNIVIELVSGD